MDSRRVPTKPGINFIFASLVFGVIYWVLEAVRDVFVFERGDLFSRIFMPDVFSCWMRLLVIFVLLLFGAVAESFRKKIEQIERDVPKPLPRVNLVLVGVGFGVLYWILEAIRDVFVFERGSFFARIFHPDAMGVWMRLLALGVLLLFSLYVHYLIEERKKAEENLRIAHGELEKLVRQRTGELIRANELLNQEIAERRRAENELRKVNRALRTLSRCNEIMVRAGEEKILLEEICNTIVDVGEYPLVWVGLFDQGNEVQFKPVSYALWEKLPIDFQEFQKQSLERFQSMVELIHSGKYQIFKPLDPLLQLPLKGENKQTSFHALLSLPLITAGQKIGVLSIYANEPGEFEMEEVHLFKELADDLAFGITAIRAQIEKKCMEGEKQKIQAQLLQSQKMEAVGVLAGGIAHDFNNLLTAIQVSADLALLDLEKDHPSRKTLEEIIAVSSHAGDLARQLLMFSRKHPMEYVTLNLNDTVMGLHKMLSRVIGEDIVVETRLEKNLWNILADRGTMEQVIMNIAVNARDAMPHGGTLVIQTENVTLDEKQAKKFPEVRPGQFVKLTMTDTGIGMDQETLEHIFEPFFSTKGPGKGTGLGLSVVYGIVKQHEGWITATSQPGKGACFEIYFPVVTDRTSISIPEKQVSGDVRGKGEKILLVEDEESVCHSTTLALEKVGYDVTMAHNAEEALKIFRKTKNFDLVFCDVVLPDRSSVELVEELISKNSKLKVLFSSGYTDQKSQWLKILGQGYRYIQKPYALQDLLRVLREVFTATA